MSYKKLFINCSEGDEESELQGSIPTHLRGTAFIFNGPTGKWDLKHESAKHFFDGFAMLQKFAVTADGSTVKLKKRFLQSDAFVKGDKYGKYVYTEYGTAGQGDPDAGLVSRMLSSIIPGEMTDNCSTSLYRMDGKLVAATETCLLRIVQPETLETGAKIDLSKLVNIASALPLKDNANGGGDLYNLAATFTTGLKYHFTKTPADDSSQTALLSTIPSRLKTAFSYYHSFGMSEKYLVLIEQPWVANSVRLAASRIRGEALKDCLEWRPEEKNIFHVVEKDGGRRLSQKYKSKKPFFFLNHVNTFEAGGDLLVIDLVAYDSPEVLDAMYMEKLRGEESAAFEFEDKSRLVRFILPLSPPSRKTSEDDDEPVNMLPISQMGKLYGPSASAHLGSDGIIWLEPEFLLPDVEGCETPLINPNFLGKKYRYCYMTGWLSRSGISANSVIKVDLQRNEIVASWRGDPCSYPGAPIFVANKTGGDLSGEDDGVLVATVTNVRDGGGSKDLILFLGARTLTELARAEFAARIPLPSRGIQDP